MSSRLLPRALDARPTVIASCALTLAIGALFVFVRAPHPWGHEGFDHYHQLALALAAGRPFPTMEVPWGYAYFLAAFYWLFGDHPAIPLLAQILLNATVPLLVFAFARPWVAHRTATLAAVLTGVLSFNTVYASTQSSDAVCTVIFLAAIVAFTVALRADRWPWFALVGMLAGVAPQFRPNLVLVPVLLAGYAVATRPDRRRAAGAAALLAAAALSLAPWVVRNYRLTHTLLPTSVHGGVQLWYGTLQVGPYLHSRAYNPRAVFDAPAFAYTSLDGVPLIVTGTMADRCGGASRQTVSLVYWTDRDPAPRQIPASVRDVHLRADIPPPGVSPTVVYYYWSAAWQRADGSRVTATTPPAGAQAPQTYFVSQDHLGDLDRHGDLLDIFDLARLVRHLAWRESMPFEARLSAAGVPLATLEPAARLLAGGSLDLRVVDGPVVVAFDHDRGSARVTFADGSLLVVPRAWNGLVTDLQATGPLATRLLSSTVSIAALAHLRTRDAPGVQACMRAGDLSVNGVFYREEPQAMRRYSALAWDNIRRAPFAFAAASLWRSVRLFIIAGTDDPQTAQQFHGSGLVYAAGTAASTAYLALFAAGVVIAWRRRLAVGLPLLLVAYVPATIAPVLTNMRYTVTVQPIVFIFIAVALTAWLERAGLLQATTAGRGCEGTQTARRP